MWACEHIRRGNRAQKGLPAKRNQREPMIGKPKSNAKLWGNRKVSQKRSERRSLKRSSKRIEIHCEVKGKRKRSRLTKSIKTSKRSLYERQAIQTRLGRAPIANTCWTLNAKATHNVMTFHTSVPTQGSQRWMFSFCQLATSKSAQAHIANQFTIGFPLRHVSSHTQGFQRWMFDNSSCTHRYREGTIGNLCPCVVGPNNQKVVNSHRWMFTQVEQVRQLAKAKPSKRIFAKLRRFESNLTHCEAIKQAKLKHSVGKGPNKH